MTTRLPNIASARRRFTRAHEELRAGRHAYKIETFPATGTITREYAEKCAKRAKEMGLYAPSTYIRDVLRSLVYAWCNHETTGDIFHKPRLDVYYRWLLKRGVTGWWGAGDKAYLRESIKFYERIRA